jgi:hypothetical protein
VTVDEPQGAIFGGTVAAPVFQKIARFALQYLSIPPDNPSELTGSAGFPSGSSATGTSGTATSQTATSQTATSSSVGH